MEPTEQLAVPPPIPGLPPFDDERVAFATTMFAALATGEPDDLDLDPCQDLIEWYPEFAEVLKAFSASVKAEIATAFHDDPDERTDSLVENGQDAVAEMAITSPDLRYLGDADSEVLSLAIGAVTAWWCFMEDSLFCSDVEAQAWIALWIGFFVDLQLTTAAERAEQATGLAET